MTLAQGSDAAGRGRTAFGAGQEFSLRSGDDFDRNVWCVLGLPLDIADSIAAAGQIEMAIRDRRRLIVATPNVNWLVRSFREERARREILEADLSVADGAPVAFIARLLGAPMKGRTAGSDVFEALRARSGVSGRRVRVFFFGGRDGAAAAATDALRHAPGGLEPAGFLNPGHGDVASMSSDAVIDEINGAKPDLIVVSLSAAKGQEWIYRNKSRLSASVISPLGAVVDFTAGTKARAPRWMRRSGLEWLWRIYAEPALWKRYVSDGSGFVGLAATHVLPQLGIGRSTAAPPPRADMGNEKGATLVRLSGQLTGDLSAVRQSFREASAVEGDVVLDLSLVKTLDRAFLGLVLMLDKHVTRRGAKIALRGVSRTQQKLFKVNAMNYPTTIAENGSTAESVARAAAS